MMLRVLVELTNTRVSDVIDLFHDKAPRAPVMFNYNAESFYWAVERRLPLLTNCTDSPGKDLVGPSAPFATSRANQ
jgi:hypothetical protein